MIQNIGSVMNNRSYVEKVCYNISMIYLTEIIKIIINLTNNHDQYHIEEFCNCEEIFRTIRLLDHIRTFLESL